MDARSLEVLLKRHSHDTSVVKVLHVDAAPALAKGENYTTSILRAKARVLLGSGDESWVHLVVKRRLDGPQVPESYKYLMALLINIEYLTYTQVLPHYERILKDANEVESKLWPDVIGHVSSNEIYFADLKISGYKMAIRQVGLDIDHALLVMRSLGKMHAASAVALHRGKFHKFSGRNHFLIRNDDTAKDFICGALEAAVDVIRTEWENKWSHLADKLELFSDRILDKLEALGTVDEKRINVFNHGDTWVNNMMFKYSSDGYPINIKFIDFQLCHYNSFGFDLIYFLYSSIHPDLRQSHLEDLLTAYQASYSRVVAKLEPTLDRMTLAVVKDELHRLLPAGCVVSVWLRSVVMGDKEEDVLPIFQIFSKGKESPGRALFGNPNYIEVLQKDLTQIFSEIKLPLP